MFKIDIHVHTALGGDSLIQPDELVDRAREVGLDAVCVTEHHSYFLSNPFREISQRTGFPIFQGLEYRAMEGHLLLFGAKVDDEDFPARMPMQWAADWVHDHGGVAIPAHPYQSGTIHGFPGERVMEVTGLLALETVNGSLSSEENQAAMDAAARLGVHGTGGSDAHGLRVLGRAYTQFSAPIRSEAELIEALRAGGYAPGWNDDFYADDRLLHWPDMGI